MVIEVEEVVEEDQAFFRHPGTVTGPKVPTQWKTLADFIWLNLSSNAKKKHWYMAAVGFAVERIYH